MVKTKRGVILREIVARCPRKKGVLFELVNQHACRNCQYRGRIWEVNLLDRPYSFTIECLYKKESEDS
jgi:hypothetical protein